MRFIHTSDWHLGILFHGMSMREEQQDFAEELLKIAAEEQADAVVVAGDVFNTSVAGAQAVSLYSDVVTRLSQNGIKLLIIAGNHDGAERLQMCGRLLAQAGVYIAGRLQREIEPVIIDDAHFYLIPYFNMEEVKALYPEQDIKSYEEAMETVLAQIKKDMDPFKKNIIVSHCFVGGAQTSGSDKSAVVGTLNLVGKNLFSDFYYTALGHIHKGQTLKDNIRYCGTPLKYSFSEAGYQNGVILVDTVRNEIKKITLHTGRDVKVYRGTYDELMNLESCDDFVKVEVTDRFAGITVIDAFRSKFKNLLMISGKTVQGGLEETMSVYELEAADPMELMNRFYMEMMNEKPGKAQADLFQEALEAADEECDAM